MNLNPTSQIFSVFYEDDLIPSGATEQSYPVTASITLTDSLGVATVQQAPFKLTIRNPCIDVNVVSTPMEVELPDLVIYTLYSDPPDGVMFSTDSLIQIELTTPDPNEVCIQGLSYGVTINGGTVDASTKPLMI